MMRKAKWYGRQNSHIGELKSDQPWTRGEVCAGAADNAKRDIERLALQIVAGRRVGSPHPCLAESKISSLGSSGFPDCAPSQHFPRSWYASTYKSWRTQRSAACSTNKANFSATKCASIS